MSTYRVNKKNIDKIYDMIQKKDVNNFFMSLDIRDNTLYSFHESPHNNNVFWFKINHKYRSIYISQYLTKDLLDTNINLYDIKILKKYLLYLISVIRLMINKN